MCYSGKSLDVSPLFTSYSSPETSITERLWRLHHSRATVVFLRCMQGTTLGDATMQRLHAGLSQLDDSIARNYSSLNDASRVQNVSSLPF